MRKISFLLMIFFSLHSLELKRVILSTNNDPSYIQFWPIVAPLWRKMGLKPTLALVANENCPIDDGIGDVIRFDPLIDVPESLQAQVIRLLLPILFPEDGCLISDIDMLPISELYFHRGASYCPDHAFLVYRNKAPGYERRGTYPMCYLAAKGSIFSSVFGISSIEQIPDLIRKWAQMGLGWNTDERVTYFYAKKWEQNGGQLLCLNHTVGPRLDRSYWNIDFKHLDITQYIDCHCPRPYLKYYQSIDAIIEAIHNSRIAE